MVLLAAWLLLTAKAEAGQEQVSELLSFIFLFLSVAAHELGHALMAKKLGIRTKDITLYPFGGVASLLDRINPKQELLITLAGPLVNIVIVSAILIFLGPDKVFQVSFLQSALGNIFAINAALAIFNSLPAFPMDGGRILRSSLQLIGVRSATKIAARFSQSICIGLALLAFYYSHPVLLVISIFVFYNASRELILGQVQGTSSNLVASQVMVSLNSLQQLSPSTTLESAAKFGLRSLQSYFPICIGSRILGLVDRDTILQKACSTIEDQYITEIMLRDLPCCEANTNLQDLILAFEQHNTPAILVGNSDACIGIIFKEQLNDLLLVNEMVRQNLEHRELERELGSP
jgi:stage IV sporulation protein FB